MRRRDLIALAPAVLALGAAQPAAAATVASDLLRRQARALAARPYQLPGHPLPATLAKLNYDGYRDLRYRPDQSVWRDKALPFQLQMFHRGFMFRDPVELSELVDGKVQPIAYRHEMFTFGKVETGPMPADLGYAGFRVHTQINTAGVFDEVAAFLGASYFRIVAKGGVYGLSARGLAIGSGAPGEEFPAFRSFILERPAPNAATFVIHALMDSPSVAGAYRFAITAGEPTQVEVQASLYPRIRLTTAGIAPLTSMFLFGPDHEARFDDFRPQVHDSDGLLMENARGERLWRPLSNPRVVQTSAFLDTAPKGFGLMQRQRAFETYQDLEANYERRPGVWIEPLEGFGAGEVRLVELPGKDETEDNIVAFWAPAQPLEPRRERRFRYRMHWGAQPGPQTALAQVRLWRTGVGSEPHRRRFVLDFAGALGAPDQISPDITASVGGIRHIVVQPNASIGGIRLSFEFEPGRASVSELRASLLRGQQPISEVWSQRWLA